MLIAAGSKPIGEPQERLLIDRVEHVDHGLLRDLVLHTQNAERSLRAIRLVDVDTPSRLRPIPPRVQSRMQVLEVFFQVASVSLPRHSIDAGSRVTLQRVVALLQQLRCDVVQQCGERFCSSLSRLVAHPEQT